MDGGSGEYAISLNAEHRTLNFEMLNQITAVSKRRDHLIMSVNMPVILIEQIRLPELPHRNEIGYRAEPSGIW
jgi:hypothetical protein